MEVSLFFAVFFGILSIYFTIRTMRKKTHPSLIKEANRYFRGSVVKNEDKLYESRVYSTGLACVEENGKYKFYKQAKWCDTGLIY